MARLQWRVCIQCIQLSGGPSGISWHRELVQVLQAILSPNSLVGWVEELPYVLQSDISPGKEGVTAGSLSYPANRFRGLKIPRIILPGILCSFTRYFLYFTRYSYGFTR